MMERNLDRRVEALLDVTSPETQARLREILAVELADDELAWELAATRLDRFTGLVVIDRGHPRVADLAGVVRDDHCPPVEINTTALVSNSAAHSPPSLARIS